MVLTLRSSRDGGALEVDQRDGRTWQATLTCPGLSAAVSVDGSGYQIGAPLSVLFQRMADDWRGWDGARTWSTLEGELDLSASHDGLAHVELLVRVRSGPDEDDWRAEATIVLDAGRLGAVLRDVRAFDAAAGGA